MATRRHLRPRCVRRALGAVSFPFLGRDLYYEPVVATGSSVVNPDSPDGRTVALSRAIERLSERCWITVPSGVRR